MPRQNRQYTPVFFFCSLKTPLSASKVTSATSSISPLVSCKLHFTLWDRHFVRRPVPGSPAAPSASYGKSGGRREPSYCETDSSISSDMGGGGGGRGSSRSSFGSSLSGSPGGSEGSFRGKDPMQYSDDEDEGKEGYKVGGYHTVNVSRCTASCEAPCLFSVVAGATCTKAAVSECFKTNDQYGTA